VSDATAGRFEVQAMNGRIGKTQGRRSMAAVSCVTARSVRAALLRSELNPRVRIAPNMTVPDPKIPISRLCISPWLWIRFSDRYPPLVSQASTVLSIAREAQNHSSHRERLAAFHAVRGATFILCRRVQSRGTMRTLDFRHCAGPSIDECQHAAGSGRNQAALRQFTRRLDQPILNRRSTML
jgi:hypothetical protein